MGRLGGPGGAGSVTTRGGRAERLNGSVVVDLVVTTAIGRLSRSPWDLAVATGCSGGDETDNTRSFSEDNCLP